MCYPGIAIEVGSAICWLQGANRSLELSWNCLCQVAFGTPALFKNVIRWDALPKFVCKAFCKLLLHHLTFVSHSTQWLRGTRDLQVLITEFPLNYKAWKIFCGFVATPWEQSLNKAVRTWGRDIFPWVYWFRSWHNKVFKPNLIITCY